MARKTVEQQMGSWKRAKCLGVHDCEGNDLSWERYVYLNNCVVSLGQISALPPSVAHRDITEEGHYIVIENPLDVIQ
eukprot:8172216-Prorocentrum_lima.AAC.1